MGWLRQRFLLATGLLLLLTLAAAAYVVREINLLARQRAEIQLLDTTRALSQVVEGQLRQFETMLLALAGDEALQRGDYAAFDRRARALLAGPDAWIVIGDRRGKQLVNTRLPAGAPLLTGRPPIKAFKTLDRGRTHICDLTQGIVSKQILCVDVPVRRGGRVDHHLSVVFKPSFLQRILDRQRIPRSRFATIIDSSGTVVWRSAAPERFVGKPATADLRAALARSGEGVKDSVSLEGIPTVASFSRSASGYSFIVAVPREQLATYRGPLLRSGLVVAAALIILAVGLALFLGNRLSNAITSLALAANRFAAGDAGAFRRTRIPEVDAVGETLERAFREREATEERLRDISNAMPVLISYVDRDKRFRFLNRTYEEWFGRPLSELLDRPLADLMSPEMYQRRLPWIERALAGETVQYEVAFPHPQGHRDTAVMHLPHFSPSGEVLGMYALVQDITPLKKVEAELRASRDRFAAVLDAAPAAILIATDPSCERIEGNAASHRLMGIAPGANLSKSGASATGLPFRVFDAEDRELSPNDLPVQRAARGEELWMHEERVELADGRSIYLLGNAVPLRGPDGSLQGAVGAFIDITERKRAEEHQKLLVGELNHRVKNTLAIVQALAQQSFRDGRPVDICRAAFEARLAALAAAHNLLTRQSWEQADLARIVETSVLAALGAQATRVEIEGPSVNLRPQTAVSVAMAIHELCTNALKYGALSVESGRVRLCWETEGEPPRLRLTWTEQGGPPVREPESRGFGSRMIERGLAAELGGEAKLSFEQLGLRFELVAPLPKGAEGA
ncbi:sensor histidine kinase [Sphingomonas sp.]|uniref:sensor histidine kinase n=1 Tax=Sphingomonas sp. TaxID=28214 RepID=UPI002DF5453F|nr:PAS domain-containing protein [Sphingomonas sp.]